MVPHGGPGDGDSGNEAREERDMGVPTIEELLHSASNTTSTADMAKLNALAMLVVAEQLRELTDAVRETHATLKGIEGSLDYVGEILDARLG
jgi:hypothetical protein